MSTKTTYINSLATKECKYNELSKIASSSSSSSFKMNSIFTCSNSSSSSSASSKLSFAQKMQYIANGCTASGCIVALASDVKGLCATKDSGTNDDGKSTTSVKDSLSDAISAADKSGNWTEVQSQAQTAQNTLTTNQTKASTLRTQSDDKQKIIEACNNSTDSDYKTATKTADEAYDTACTNADTDYNNTKSTIDSGLTTLKNSLNKATDLTKKAAIQKQIDAKTEELKKAKDKCDEAKKTAQDKKDTKYSDAQKQMETKKTDAQAQKETYDKQYEQLNKENTALQKTITEAKNKLAQRDLSVGTNNSDSTTTTATNTTTAATTGSSSSSSSSNPYKLGFLGIFAK